MLHQKHGGFPSISAIKIGKNRRRNTNREEKKKLLSLLWTYRISKEKIQIDHITDFQLRVSQLQI